MKKKLEGISHVPQYNITDEGFSWLGSGRTSQFLWKTLGIVACIVVFLVASSLTGWWIVTKKLAKPEEKFVAQVKDCIKNDSGIEGQISKDEMDKLTVKAANLKISDEMEVLIGRAKKEYLDEKRQTLFNNPPGTEEITPEERAELCKLAKAMGIPDEDCKPLEESTVEEVKVSLRKGEFATAEKLLESMSDTPEKTRLVSEMATTLNLAVNLQYQIGTEKPSQLYSIEAPELNNLSLTHCDNYRLSISSSCENLYLYVFQKDHYGQIKRLFPDPIWSETDNPIDSGMNYQIPPGEKEWLYLDELPTSQGESNEEIIYIVASPWMAEDIEILYADIYRFTSRKDREGAVKKFLEGLNLRKDAQLKAVYYKEFLFNHGGVKDLGQS